MPSTVGGLGVGGKGDQPTCGQEAIINVGVVLGPDENQQHEQQTLEQHQEIEDLYLELIEADEVDGGVRSLEQHDPEVGQRKTIVQNGQRVEFGERGQTVQTADRRGCVVQRAVIDVFLKFHHSSGTAAMIVHVTDAGANICGKRTGTTSSAETCFLFACYGSNARWSRTERDNARLFDNGHRSVYNVSVGGPRRTNARPSTNNRDNEGRRCNTGRERIGLLAARRRPLAVVFDNPARRRAVNVFTKYVLQSSIFPIKCLKI